MSSPGLGTLIGSSFGRKIKTRSLIMSKLQKFRSWIYENACWNLTEVDNPFMKNHEKGLSLILPSEIMKKSSSPGGMNHRGDGKPFQWSLWEELLCVFSFIILYGPVWIPHPTGPIFIFLFVEPGQRSPVYTDPHQTHINIVGVSWGNELFSCLTGSCHIEGSW